MKNRPYGALTSHLKIIEPTLHPLSLATNPLNGLHEGEILWALNDWPSEGQQSLRAIVDDWIASGVDASGINDPYERHFGKLSTNQLLKRLRSNREKEEAFQVVGDLVSGSQETDAEKAIRIAGASLLRVVPDSEGIHLYVQEPSETDPRLCAYSFFFKLIASSLRFRIASCRGCGVYFLLPAKRAVYKTGTRCPSCYKETRSSESRRITKSSRDQKRKLVYRYIKKKFGRVIVKTPTWYQDAAFVERIVESVNAAIAAGQLRHVPITGKWVVRNSDPDNRGAISQMAAEQIASGSL